MYGDFRNCKTCRCWYDDIVVALQATSKANQILGVRGLMRRYVASRSQQARCSKVIAIHSAACGPEKAGWISRFESDLIGVYIPISLGTPQICF
jgi:hypothetical protein